MNHNTLACHNPVKCTCGEVATKCDPHGMAHFNRMQEKDQHANEGECGIFSGMEPETEEEKQARRKRMSDDAMQAIIADEIEEDEKDDNEERRLQEDNTASIIAHDIVCECGSQNFCPIHDEA